MPKDDPGAEFDRLVSRTVPPKEDAATEFDRLVRKGLPAAGQGVSDEYSLAEHAARPLPPRPLSYQNPLDAAYGLRDNLPGAVGGVMGAGVGGTAGLIFGPQAPLVTSPAGAVVGGKIAQKMSDAIMPKDWKDASAEAYNRSPDFYNVGAVLSNLVGAKPANPATMFNHLPNKVIGGSVGGVVSKAMEDLLAPSQPYETPPIAANQAGTVNYSGTVSDTPVTSSLEHAISKGKEALGLESPEGQGLNSTIAEYIKSALHGAGMSILTEPNAFGKYMSDPTYRQDLANKRAAKRLVDIVVPDKSARAAAIANLDAPNELNGNGVNLLPAEVAMANGTAPELAKLVEIAALNDPTNSLGKRETQNADQIKANVNAATARQGTSTPEDLRTEARNQEQARAVDTKAKVDQIRANQETNNSEFEAKLAKMQADLDAANSAKAAIGDEAIEGAKSTNRINAAEKVRELRSQNEEFHKGKLNELVAQLPKDTSFQDTPIVQEIQDIKAGITRNDKGQPVNTGKALGAKLHPYLSEVLDLLNVDPHAKSPDEAGRVPKEIPFENLRKTSQILGDKIRGLDKGGSENYENKDQLVRLKGTIDKMLFEAPNEKGGEPLKEFRRYYRDEIASRFIHDKGRDLSAAGKNGGANKVYAENTLDNAFGSASSDAQDAAQLMRSIDQTPEGVQHVGDYLASRMKNDLGGKITPDSLKLWRARNEHLTKQVPGFDDALDVLENRVTSAHETADRLQWALKELKSQKPVLSEAEAQRVEKAAEKANKESPLAPFASETANPEVDFKPALRSMLFGNGKEPGGKAAALVRATAKNPQAAQELKNQFLEILREELSVRSANKKGGNTVEAPDLSEKNITQTSLFDLIAKGGTSRAVAEIILGKNSPELKILDQAYSQMQAMNRLFEQRKAVSGSETGGRSILRDIANESQDSVLQRLARHSLGGKVAGSSLGILKSIWGSEPQPQEVYKFLTESHLDPALYKELLRPADKINPATIKKIQGLAAPYITPTNPNDKKE